MNNASRPVVGITSFAFKQRRRPPRFGLNQSYCRAVELAGAAPILLPPLQDQAVLRAYYERVDGLLFSGGDDIDPDLYGESRHEKCGTIEPERDGMELTLARWAATEGKPLLAICRGIQVLNVALGGTLYQDIAAQVPGALQHPWQPGNARDHLAHEVLVRPETQLARILALGADGAAPVNSMHHQAVKAPAPGLRVTAVAPDRIVEAVEMDDHRFAVGVQWHPEELVDRDPRARDLFLAFVQACRG